MRLKAHYLSFQTHFESLKLNNFSIFYWMLKLKCLFDFMTVYKVTKIHVQYWEFYIENKMYNAGEKLNVIILKKSNKKFSICSMIMNQNAFESSLLKLSNALRIVKIEQFFDFLLDVKVEVFF